MTSRGSLYVENVGLALCWFQDDIGYCTKSILDRMFKREPEVFWISFLNGSQRVLIFTEDPVLAMNVYQVVGSSLT